MLRERTGGVILSSDLTLSHSLNSHARPHFSYSNQQLHEKKTSEFEVNYTEPINMFII